MVTQNLVDETERVARNCSDLCCLPAPILETILELIEFWRKENPPPKCLVCWQYDCPEHSGQLERN